MVVRVTHRFSDAEVTTGEEITHCRRMGDGLTDARPLAEGLGGPVTDGWCPMLSVDGTDLDLLPERSGGVNQPRLLLSRTALSLVQGGCTSSSELNSPPPATPSRAPKRYEPSSLRCSTSLERREPWSPGGLLAYSCFCCASFRRVTAHNSQGH